MRKLAQGFTLIEMLVVISIIGILAVLISANLNSARSRARDTERKSDIKNIETALRLYYNDYGSYPKGGASSNYLIDGCGASGVASCSWGSEWNVGNVVYMQTLPADPLSPNQVYRYQQGATSDNFTLQACMENGSDSQGMPSGGLCASGLMFQVAE